MQAQIIPFPCRFTPAQANRTVDVNFIGIFEKLARAANLTDAKIMAKVLCNGMYANNYLTCDEWENIMAALDPQFLERRHP